MKKNIVIIHYNTPHLTECLVRSINLFVNDAVIYVFDNSDKNPFTAEFDNVTVLDNTKGQIINFNKWLEKYPNKNRSNGKTNGWGSAKHCYSVEKCMEILKENFILLDSDILLKRDISNLYRDDLMYVGNVITQPNSTVKRVLPFICYINVKMCIEKNVHYFDENYMHGLSYTRNNPYADRYDTGGAFYLQASKYKHEEIDYGNYAVHYGHGSWHKRGEKTKISASDWLKFYKKLWSNEKNKKVVYTCITGGYDSLIDPSYITEGFDYVCFTDNQIMNSDIWEIRPLPKETEGLSQVKKQRFVKINPHLFLKEYDMSIWVDGNVAVKGDLNEFIIANGKDDVAVYVPQHPARNCIYKEGSAVISMRKDKKEIVEPQMKRYKEEGFPENYGLLQSNIMFRKHNKEACIKLMKTWSDEVVNNSHRDQLSFNYALWKNEDVKVIYMDKNICKSKYFFWNSSHKNRQIGRNTTRTRQKITKDIAQVRKEFREVMNKTRRVSTYKVPIYY
jgi:hypothetical protein